MRKSKKLMSLGILLDTSFLLPIVGIRVKYAETILESLRVKFRKGEVEIYYTDLNLLEIAWKLAKIQYSPTTRAGAFKHRENFKKISISSEVLLEALELRKRGFKDIIDLVLYIAARENNLKFLTLDRGMASFLKKRALQGTNQTAKRMSF